MIDKINKTTDSAISDLYMIQARLDGLELAKMAKVSHLPPHAADNGYLVHMTLRELFGQLAPQPFVINKYKGRTLEILGYALNPVEEIQKHADTFAYPEKHRLCDWSRLSGKQMPKAWPEGKMLGFELKTCPVKRMAKSGKHHKKGAEVDVFLAKCWEMEDPSIPVDRYAVYREWLSDAFSRQSGARLEQKSLEIISFRKARLVRRTQKPSTGSENGRKAIVLDKPEVTFKGRLTISDPKGFAQMLRKGIGRHKAFGYGMLLLKP